MRFEDLTRDDLEEVRELVLAGLADHWGELDPALNPDLDDMLASYSNGRTVVARSDDGRIIATGTVIPRDDTAAEIVRMSVATHARRTGLGRALVEELVATANGWGVARVILETTSAWTDVMVFYLSCGFHITHTAGQVEDH